MMKDYLSMIYENDDASLVKLSGYIVTAIDGSNFILPSTGENTEKYGVHDREGAEGPVMGQLSLVYDCINKLAIDTCIGEYKHSERAFTAQHLHELKETLRQPTITTFDRDYFSIRLVDQMMDDGKKFVMRMASRNLKRYSNQLDSAQDKTFDMIFNRIQTNPYREDRAFRTKLMSITYPLRFVKIPLIKPETGEAYDEVLLTNLWPEEFSLAELKELYRLRWEIETVYNVLKNQMKLEEFRGVREQLILQEIYCYV